MELNSPTKERRRTKITLADILLAGIAFGLLAGAIALGLVAFARH